MKTAYPDWEKGVSWKAGEKFRFVCCDCGLTHDVVLMPGRDVVGMAMKRNQRATIARRKSKGITGIKSYTGREGE